MAGYLLLQNQNPNSRVRDDGLQYWGYPVMNYAPSLIVIHTAENALDEIAPDTGAENIGYYFTRSSTAASYHTVVDSDSIVDCLPAGLDGAAYTAFHATSANSWTLGLSFACRTVDWRRMTTSQRDGFLMNGARRAAQWCRRWDIPPMRVDYVQAEANYPRIRGFISHADVQTDRSDPGADFPWTHFLGLVAVEITKLSGPNSPINQPTSTEDQYMYSAVRTNDGQIFLVNLSTGVAERLVEDVMPKFKSLGVPSTMWKEHLQNLKAAGLLKPGAAGPDNLWSNITDDVRLQLGI